MKKSLLLALSVLGIVISGYLAYAKLTNNPLICGSSQGCDVVQNSQYSTLLGIPLGFWGMLYYFVLFSVFYIEDVIQIKLIRKLWIFWGVVFSSYLTYIEAFVLYAYCLWCITSFINLILIALIYFFYKDKQKLQEKLPQKS